MKRVGPLHVFAATVLLTFAAAAMAETPSFDTARCERSSDLLQWRCQLTCASGDSGVGTCAFQTGWETCGQQGLREVCAASGETTTAAACRRKTVLAGADLDRLTAACEQSFGGFDEEIPATPGTERFPGLITRRAPEPEPKDGTAGPSAGRLEG